MPSGHKVVYGEILPEPFLEVSTKLEKTDRLLEKAEALQISGLSSQEYEDAREVVLKIDEDIGKSVASRGLIHVDGKKELAFDDGRQIMVIDVYGTADEDRFWDKARYEQGEFVDLSKEYVRQYYRQTGYKDQLYAARDAGRNGACHPGSASSSGARDEPDLHQTLRDDHRRKVLARRAKLGLND